MVAQSTSRCAVLVEQKIGMLRGEKRHLELPSATASVSSGPSGARHGARGGLRTHVGSRSWAAGRREPQGLPPPRRRRLASSRCAATLPLPPHPSFPASLCSIEDLPDDVLERVFAQAGTHDG